MDRDKLRKRHRQNTFNAILMASQACLLILLFLGVLDSIIIATVPLQVFAMEVVIDGIMWLVNRLKGNKH